MVYRTMQCAETIRIAYGKFKAATFLIIYSNKPSLVTKSIEFEADKLLVINL